MTATEDTYCPYMGDVLPWCDSGGLRDVPLMHSPYVKVVSARTRCILPQAKRANRSQRANSSRIISHYFLPQTSDSLAWTDFTASCTVCAMAYCPEDADASAPEGILRTTDISLPSKPLATACTRRSPCTLRHLRLTCRLMGDSIGSCENCGGPSLRSRPRLFSITSPSAFPRRSRGILRCARVNETLPAQRASRRAITHAVQSSSLQDELYYAPVLQGMRAHGLVSAMAFWTISPHQLGQVLHDLLVELNPGRLLALHAGQHEDRYAVDLRCSQEEEYVRL